MRTACSRAGHPKRIICTNATPYEGFAQSCAQLQLPPADAEISGSLPDGYDWRGRPPAPTPTSRPPPANAPYDVTTAAGYREWAIRRAYALCETGSEPTSGWNTPPWLSPVDDLSDVRFSWNFQSRSSQGLVDRYNLVTAPGCGGYERGTAVCATHSPYGNIGLSCAQLQLPPTGATVNRAALPAGYNQYGEPPTARRPTTPTTPEPEPEDPEDPEDPEPENPEATRAWL